MQVAAAHNMNKVNTLLISLAIILVLVFGTLVTLLVIRTQNQGGSTDSQVEPAVADTETPVVYSTFAPRDPNNRIQRTQETITITQGAFDRRLWNQPPNTDLVLQNADAEPYTIIDPSGKIAEFVLNPGQTQIIQIESQPPFMLQIKNESTAALQIVPQ